MLLKLKQKVLYTKYCKYLNLKILHYVLVLLYLNVITFVILAMLRALYKRSDFPCA